MVPVLHIIPGRAFHTALLARNNVCIALFTTHHTRSNTPENMYCPSMEDVCKSGVERQGVGGGGWRGEGGGRVSRASITATSLFIFLTSYTPIGPHQWHVGCTPTLPGAPTHILHSSTALDAARSCLQQRTR